MVIRQGIRVSAVGAGIGLARRGRWCGAALPTARALALAFLPAVAAACSDPVRPGTSRLALVGATLVDGTGAPARARTTLVIEDGLVAAVAPDGEIILAPSMPTLDLEGMWVVPGLVDTHVHMPAPPLQDVFLRTLLSFGVTTARSTAAAPDGGVALRARIESGEQLGPRFLTAGRLIDAPGTVWDGFASVVATASEIRDEVARQAEQGVDFIKLYAGLEPELVRAGIDAAHARGLPVIGHLGRTTWTEAAAAGIDALTHSCLWGMAHSLVPLADSASFTEFFLPNAGFDPGRFAAWRASVSLTDPRFVDFARLAAGERVAIDPNLVLCEAVVRGGDAETYGRLQTQLDVQPAPFPHPYSSGWSDAERTEAEATFQTFLDVVGALHSAGVLLTLGSDTMNPWMTPGAAALREVELLALAGIPSGDVLRIATRNGAEALGILDEVGTLEVGKAADLLVLREDPLASISNLRTLDRVVRAGVVLEPEALRVR